MSIVNCLPVPYQRREFLKSYNQEKDIENILYFTGNLDNLKENRMPKISMETKDGYILGEINLTA